jgi:DNA-binding transcriptional regulator YiaG
MSVHRPVARAKHAPYRVRMRPADLVILAEMRAACVSGSARTTRLSARLTQAEMAEACQVSPRTVAAWEAGQRIPGGHPALEYGRLLAKLSRMVAA